jgi:hypothetical protein
MGAVFLSIPVRYAVSERGKSPIWRRRRIFVDNIKKNLQDIFYEGKKGMEITQLYPIAAFRVWGFKFLDSSARETKRYDRVCSTLPHNQEVPIQVSIRKSAILTKSFHSFPQFLRGNATNSILN